MSLNIASSASVGCPASDMSDALRAGSLDWTLRLLGCANLQVSLFRLRVHGVSAVATPSARTLIEERFGAAFTMDWRADGSAVLLLVRTSETGQMATRRVLEEVTDMLRQPSWPHYAVVEVAGIHKSSSEVLDSGDVVAELSSAPRAFLDGACAANHPT